MTRPFIITMSKKNGFTLVEVLLVVAIIALLATISMPGYLQVVRRGRCPEAIATMSIIRQGLRDYFISRNAYFSIAPSTPPLGNNISLEPDSGVAYTVGIAHYFSGGAYSVDHTSPAWTSGSISPPPQDFVITANGAVYNSVSAPTAPNVRCTSVITTNCAISADLVNTFRLEMDNTGRVFVSYDGGTRWVGY